MAKKCGALGVVALAGLLLAVAATGNPGKGHGPRKKTTTTVTTTVETTTTVATTSTVAARTRPAPPAPQLADISVTSLATSAEPVYDGSTVTYTGVVTNHGPDAASGVYLAVALEGATLVGDATEAGSCAAVGTLSCALGSLASGASESVTVTLAPSAGSRSVEALLSSGSDEPDPQAANNASRLETDVLPGHAGAPVLALPGGSFLPPLRAVASGAARVVSARVHVDEPVQLSVQLVDARSHIVRMLPGTLVDYLPSRRPHTLVPHAVGDAGWVPLRLRFAAPAGRAYRIVVRAVAANGLAATQSIRFTS